MNRSSVLYWTIGDFQKDVDYFASVYENRPFTTVALIFSSISSIILLPFLLGIAWRERYGGSDVKRVVINNIIGSTVWTIIIYFMTVQPLEIFRYLFGPLPESFCFFFNVLKDTLTLQMNLLFDCVIVIRYLFIFKLKNPGAFYDGFWTAFVLAWISGFCLITQWLVHYLPGQQLLRIQFCSGIDLSNEPLQSGPKKNALMRFFITCSVLLLVAMCARIERFRRKDHIPTTWSGNQKSLFLVAIEDKFLSSYLIYLLIITNMSIGNVLVAKINSLQPYEANLYPNYLYVIVYQLISPIELVASVVLVYYAKHKKLISNLISELKE
jgi:hypothetical protein